MSTKKVEKIVNIAKDSYKDMQFSYSGNKMKFDSHLPMYVVEKEHGLYDVVFLVYSQSDVAEKDSQTKFSTVVNNCEVTLNNCEKINNAWRWREPYDHKITPSKELASVNFITEKGNDLSSSLYELDGYFGIIPADINHELNSELTQMLIDNTDHETTIKVFTEMLSDYPINLIQVTHSNK